MEYLAPGTALPAVDVDSGSELTVGVFVVLVFTFALASILGVAFGRSALEDSGAAWVVFADWLPEIVSVVAIVVIFAISGVDVWLASRNVSR